MSLPPVVSGLMLLLASCGSGPHAVIRLTPTPTASSRAAVVSSTHRALEAVGRIAVARGLRQTPAAEGCAEEWGESPVAGPGRAPALGICARFPKEGGLELRLSEGFTRQPRPEAARLRSELIDSLRAFGSVAVRP